MKTRTVSGCLWLAAVVAASWPLIGPGQSVKTEFKIYAPDKLTTQDVTRVLAECERALQANPKDVAAYQKRAECKLQQGDRAGAQADFTRAIELNPQDADAYTYRSRARKALGDAAGAEQDNAQALRLKRR